MSFRLPCSLAVLAGAVLLTPSAFAFDCAKAKTDVEKTICGNPDLKAADNALEAAYAALLPTLSLEQQAAAKANQRAWVQRREAYCGGGGQDEKQRAVCLTDMTTARTTVLAGKAESGPGTALPLKPVFMQREQSKTKCSADYAVMQFATEASGAGAKAFNGAVDKMLAGMDEDNGQRDPSIDPPYDCYYSVGGTLTYASDDIVAEDLAFETYGGGAHGMSGETAVIVDLKTGKPLTYADVFGSSADAKKKLVDACTADLVKVKKERFAEAASQDTQGANDFPDPAEDLKNYTDAIVEGVGDFKHWMIKADRVDVYFGPYEVGSYAEGPYSCTLPNSLLSEAAGVKGWVVK